MTRRIAPPMSALLELGRQAREARARFVKLHDGHGFRAPAFAGTFEVTVTRSAKVPGGWQVTVWVDDEPSSDLQAHDYAWAVFLAEWDCGADLSRASEFTSLRS